MRRSYWIAVALAFALFTAGTMVLRWQGGAPAPATEPDTARAAAGESLFDHYLIEAPKKAVQAEMFQAVPINGGPPGLEAAEDPVLRCWLGSITIINRP